MCYLKMMGACSEMVATRHLDQAILSLDEQSFQTQTQMAISMTCLKERGFRTQT